MDLRPELRPPALDEAKVARLAKLAARIDGAYPGQCEELLEEFNREAGTNFTFADFQGIYGAMDHETFVRHVLSKPAARGVPDVTRDDLLELLTRLCNAEGAEHEQQFWLRLLEAKLPDPRLSDLIYWPGEYFGDGDNARQLSPREILDIASAASPPAGGRPPDN
jgi:nucleoside-diphosphate-sugar epimerase